MDGAAVRGAESEKVGWLATAACGAFGGLAPAALEVAEAFLSGEAPELTIIFLGLSVLALVGGGCAVILKENRTMKEAFFLGVAAPALITGGLGVADQGAMRLGAEASAAHFYAATAAQPNARTLLVEDAQGAGLPGSIFIISDDGSEEESQATGEGWSVPTSAFRFVFRGLTADSVRVHTEPAEVSTGQEEVLIRLHLRPSTWGSFLDIIGLDRTARRFVEANLEVLPRSRP